MPYSRVNVEARPLGCDAHGHFHWVLCLPIFRKSSSVIKELLWNLCAASIDPYAVHPRLMVFRFGLAKRRRMVFEIEDAVCPDLAPKSEQGRKGPGVSDAQRGYRRP